MYGTMAPAMKVSVRRKGHLLVRSFVAFVVWHKTGFKLRRESDRSAFDPRMMKQTGIIDL